VNDYLTDNFVSGGTLAVCPVYVDAEMEIFPNFLTSSLFSTASRIVRDSVGGDPVPTNDVSINKLIRLVSFGCDIFCWMMGWEGFFGN
jgi:hypothetical protein